MPDPGWLALAAPAVPLAAALALLVLRREPSRAFLAVIGGIAFALSATAFGLDPFSRFMMVLYSGVSLLTLVAAPKRDRTWQEQADALLILGGTLAAYASGNLVILMAGWVLSAIPLWKRPKDAGLWAVPRVVLAVSGLALAASILLLAWEAVQAGSPAPFSLRELGALRAIDNPWIFGFAIVAVLTRKAVVPLQSSLVAACERGSLLNTMLFINGHLGLYLIVHLTTPLMPVTSHEALSPLAELALLSAAGASLMALNEQRPRRLLGLLSISQMSFLLAGIESGTEAGVAGAMAYLVVLTIATAGLFIVLRLLEVRLDTPLVLDRFHGLGATAPRLAVFFLISALALVGLPGTLGFVAEDLLFHGTLESHPELGLILPIATALNAISLLRIFARLFFGRRATLVPRVADALPAERLALSAGLLAIVFFGLRPKVLLTVTAAAAQKFLP